MLRSLLISATLLLASPCVLSDESEAGSDPDDTRETEVTGDGIERPKAMSGMSILGNEEAPKSLVIIPWKSSELGGDRQPLGYARRSSAACRPGSVPARAELSMKFDPLSKLQTQHGTTVSHLVSSGSC